MTVSATTASMAVAKVALSAHAALWIVLTVTFLCEAACLWGTGLQVDFGSTLLRVEPIMLFTALGWMFWSLDRAFAQFYSFRRATVAFQDFFFSAAQLTAVIAVSELLIYLAATAGAVFPMRDDTLEYIDSLLGYDWHVVSGWLSNHPALDKFLLCTYNSLDLQIFLTVLLGSALHPGYYNIEFIALFLVSIVITALTFTFVPVFGMFGKAHVDTFTRLLDIRAGGSPMTYSRTASLINFPSYHTALAILIPYSARHWRWLLIPTLLINIVMLAATSPEGGHYLADILAGAAVAMMSILVVRRYLPRYATQ